MRIPSGVTDQYIYFVAVDATDLKTRETGLTTFTVYRSRDGGVAAAMTTPTINETDSVNMPGVYELLLDEDMTIAVGNDSEEMVFHITHAGMAPVTRTIELYRRTVTSGDTLVSIDGIVDANMQAIDDDAVAAANLEAAFDGTGWAFTNCTIPTVTTLTGHTAQTGDSYAIVNHATYGNAKLVRSTTPANTLDVSATGEAGLDFDNIKAATAPTTLTNITVPTVTTCANNSDMRGTENAAPAATALSTATWTAARAGYLDELAAANLPTDIAEVNALVVTADAAIDAVATTIGAAGAGLTAVGLSSAAQRDIAQIVNRTPKNVYFCTSAADAGGDGLTPDTPFGYDVLKTNVEAGSAGDLFLLGPGTFALGDAVINLPNSVSMRGAAMDATLVTSTAQLATASRGCIISPGNNSLVADLTIQGTLTDGVSYQAALGTREPNAGQNAFTNAVALRVRTIGDSDSLYVRSTTSASTLTCIDCVIDSAFDGVYAYGHAGSSIDLINCTLRATGRETGFTTHSCITNAQGTVRAYNCTLVAQGMSTSTSTKGAWSSTGADALTHLAGCNIITRSAAGDVYDLVQDTGAVVTVAGCSYDVDKVSGTVTPVYPPTNVQEVEGADATDQIRDAVVNDATRIDGSALNALTAVSNIAALSIDGSGNVTPANIDGITFASLMECVLAVLTGVATVSGSDVSFKKRDGSTSKITITYGLTDGERTVSVIDN